MPCKGLASLSSGHDQGGTLRSPSDLANGPFLIKLSSDCQCFWIEFRNYIQGWIDFFYSVEIGLWKSACLLSWKFKSTYSNKIDTCEKAAFETNCKVLGRDINQIGEFLPFHEVSFSPNNENMGTAYLLPVKDTS